MIDIHDESGLRIITLNRPDKANALTTAMLESLCAAVSGAMGNAQALIITGTGKVFSAGADLDAAKAGLALSPLWEEFSGSIAAFPGLSIAALNGTCAGGATGMALACDLRISVPAAKFFYPVISLGFLPQPSDPLRLARLIGPSRAKLILLAGQKITADRALEYGLIDEIVPPEDLMTRAKELCAAPCAAAADHLAAIKTMIPAG